MRRAFKILRARIGWWFSRHDVEPAELPEWINEGHRQGGAVS